jgi:3-phosphoshikimate 1-carboxyvinyltransferase
MSDFVASPGNSLSGVITIPGDKSISHRAIIMGSIANGVTKVSGFLEGNDSLATMKSFQQMGVGIEQLGSKLIIKGVGMHGLKAPTKPLNLGNSGTSIRLMSGLLSAQSFDSELCGDQSLSKRPMDRIIEPLRQMGAKINGVNSKPPLTIFGNQALKAITYELPIASAQIKSCLLLAGLYAQGKTCIIENVTTRDHTERMLRGFGYQVICSNNSITLDGGGELEACDIDIPSDISSAAFFMVAGSIAKDADLTLKSININPTRTGIIEILKLMGADITLGNETEMAGEKIADIRVRSADLKGIEIPNELVPLAIDEFPVIFIAASCAKGETLLTDAKELRVKESDRIQVMADGLKILGIKTEVFDDGIRIQGGQFSKPNTPIKSHHDHRISMSFAVASAACNFDIKIEGVDNVKTSFPNFVELANTIGINIKEFD